MDVIKTETEVDPLAIDPSENPDAEKPNPSLIEGTLDSITVKEEIKWEVTSEEYEMATTESVLNTDLIETLKKVESPESCPSSENDAFGSRLDPLTDAHLQSDYSCQAHEALFKCVICGEMLQDFTSLKKHRLRSHRVRTSRCNVCGECFSTKLYLRYHNIRSHAGEEPFTCKICGIGFLTSGNFQNHQPKQSDKIVRVFQCETCGKQFSTPGNLVIHKRSHTGEKPFKCEVCGKHYSAVRYLKGHLRTHKGEKSFKCDVCGISYSVARSLTVHLRTHKGEKAFKCDVCGKRFSAARYLRAHLPTHKGEKPFKCAVCGKSYSVASSLKVHLRTHTGEKPFKCKYCLRRFLYSGCLRAHLRTHTVVMDVIKTEPEVDPLAIDSSENLDSEKPNPSLIEGTFDFVTVKEEIKWEVTSEECEIETTESVLNTDLIETLKKVASPENCPSSENDAFGITLDPRTDAQLQSDYSCQAHEDLFTCVICGEVLQTFHSLKMHRRRTHRFKTFRCSVCGECFSTSLFLEDHIQFHPGEEPFKCKICGIGFSPLGNFRNHQSKLENFQNNQPKQSQKNVRSYECDTCGKHFSASVKLEIHTRTHTGEKPFKCDSCGKRYSAASSLTVHLRTHTGEMPFKCDYCVRRFRYSGCLRDHLRTHTGEKPFKCDICGKCFSFYPSLRYHCFTHLNMKIKTQ